MMADGRMDCIELNARSSRGSRADGKAAPTISKMDCRGGACPTLSSPGAPVEEGRASPIPTGRFHAWRRTPGIIPEAVRLQAGLTVGVKTPPRVHPGVVVGRRARGLFIVTHVIKQDTITEMYYQFLPTLVRGSVLKKKGLGGMKSGWEAFCPWQIVAESAKSWQKPAKMRRKIGV